ncbi:MAG: ABC transporter ATP-binding protein [Lachnospiraceae bacterium]|nr:ABC transporter ATP-binding protein [Lachnospiraceae bacterium]
MGEQNSDVLLEVKNLAISFFNKTGEIQAVRGISYTLRRGEVLGIVGESGSGKSVSSHAILRLTPDTGLVKSGEILFDGRDILKMEKKELQELRGNRIAMIFQDPMTSLDPLFTVEYQLNESLKKHTDMDAAARRARMLELLEMVGINQPERRLKQYPYEFSGGMRQRVMIAMALSCNPDLLIADEPTTALDVTIQAQIIDLIKELKDKLGMAVIFITHDLGVVSDICDKIVVMYAGKIIEEGMSRQIFYDNRHPYTRGLLESVPDIESDVSEKLKPIKGNPPDMSGVKPGCAFAPRCSDAMRICIKEDAPLFEIDDTHCAACWKMVRDAKA